MLRRLDESGRNTWASVVKTLLYEHGFGFAWLNDGIGYPNNFIKCFKQRLKDCSMQYLQMKIQNSSKASHYKHFKSLLNIEKIFVR